MKHLAYFSIISLLVLFFVMLISISLIGSGTVVTSYEGFALDSNENLYLGVYGKINVYKDGSLLYSVDAHTLRAYAFTIQNDKILISDAETVYIMDLNGNVISSYEDADTSLFNKLKKDKNSFSLNGNTYKIQKNFGRSRIVKDNGKVIYQMPILDYIVKIGFLISMVWLVVLAIYWVINFRRKVDVRTKACSTERAQRQQKAHL